MEMLVNLAHAQTNFPAAPNAFVSPEQVGNLSAHALQFARFKRKRLGASKYSNLIFERFIGVFSLVFSANQKIVNPLHCWEHEEGMRTFRG